MDPRYSNPSTVSDSGICDITASREPDAQGDHISFCMPECFQGVVLSDEAKQAAAHILKPLLCGTSSVDGYALTCRHPASVQSMMREHDMGMLAGIISEQTTRHDGPSTEGYTDAVPLWHGGNFCCSKPEALIVSGLSNSVTPENGPTTGVGNGEQLSDDEQQVMTSPEKIVLAPFDYLHSLPSKNVRSKAIDALNGWYRVPDRSLAAIKSILHLLHSSSLMLDDIEDGSSLRRGKPAAHVLFGVSQTINSANYLFAIALEELSNLSSRKAYSIFASELRNLHLGQGMDLYWTCQVHCPTEAEYMMMIDGKTGGLFRLLGRLLQSESPVGSELDIEKLATMLGRYFQIRDDYQNLCSADYADQKGFCQDLDEGKFSLPLIHMLGHSQRSQLAWSMLHEGRRTGSIMYESKRLILDMMRQSGSLEYTKGVLRKLEGVIEMEVWKAEGIMQTRNYMLRLLVESLKI
ncbi:hypothetical protein L249_2460 [Ophiocordyceps polyrhachis-furcata BCC 54312]|uniref:Uncharacterized protein n=1 Tax=Ophiocordyceps polyrhachis-furcata BCC 54312 TaxID=1330021 RepID=A0A367LSB1_9HYPO|nr:hypothetical protein L249_2460 [Ophiocordyceps polyrhachis-furcata BCC 54312]